MGLFKRGDKQPEKTVATNRAHPVPARKAFCRVCDAERVFSKCWVRSAQMVQCPCCGAAFDNPARLYSKFQPACPRCGEYLEQPEFQYGLCDTCGSKYELMPGTKPGLLPNKKQRDEMNKFGKAWTPE